MGSVNVAFLADLTEKVVHAEERLRQIEIAKKRYQQFVADSMRARFQDPTEVERFLGDG